MQRGAFAHLAQAGAEFALRVTPRALKASIVLMAGVMRAYVTAKPTDGQTNAGVQVLLARVSAAGSGPKDLGQRTGATGLRCFAGDPVTAFWQVQCCCQIGHLGQRQGQPQG